MTARKPTPKAKPDCTICHGRGWFYAGHNASGWPTECFRCFPQHPNVRVKMQQQPGQR